MSLPPTQIDETAPKQNIRLLPMKKAMTVIMHPILPLLANRVKLGVALPPETKLPTTSPAPPMMPRSEVLRANWSTMVASPFCTARIIATVPRIATQGTAMKLMMVRLLMPLYALAVMQMPAIATSRYS